jgi:phage repressor protein C with HTH and peptisase S24 domain
MLQSLPDGQKNMENKDVSNGPAQEKPTIVTVSAPDMIGLVKTVHEKGAAFRFKAAGSSMRPAICHNDMITIFPLKGMPPLKGEVVAFRQPGTNGLLIHRVVRKKQGTFFIRGDNLRQTDAHVPLENILGVVTRVERRGRKLYRPDRFRHPLWARLYFRAYLVYTGIRFCVRRILRFIVTGLRTFFHH